MKKVVFRPEAELEVLEAQIWYEQQASGLGFEFARAVDAAVSSMVRNPLAHARIEGEFRRIILRRFPYSLIYLLKSTEIIVISCFHHRREPGSWHQ